jgi:hypothetical protein
MVLNAQQAREIFLALFLFLYSPLWGEVGVYVFRVGQANCYPLTFFHFFTEVFYKEEK